MTTPEKRELTGALYSEARGRCLTPEDAAKYLEPMIAMLANGEDIDDFALVQQRASLHTADGTDWNWDYTAEVSACAFGFIHSPVAKTPFLWEVKLERPDLAGRDSVEVRTPDWGDRLVILDNDVVRLVAQLTGLSYEEIHVMHLRDVMSIARVAVPLGRPAHDNGGDTPLAD